MTRLWVLEPESLDTPQDLVLHVDKEPYAKIRAPWTGDPIQVEPADGDAPWRLEAYGKGWRLVARRTDDDEPLLWFTGRKLRSGGELAVAPDRHYDLRSRLLKRLDAHVLDEDGTLLLEYRAIPRYDKECVVEVSVEQPDHPDAPLLATFAAIHGLLTFREGRLQKRHGRDGDTMIIP